MDGSSFTEIFLINYAENNCSHATLWVIHIVDSGLCPFL